MSTFAQLLRSRRGAARALAILAASAIAGPAVQGGVPANSIEDIVKAWRSRQDEVHSLAFSWTARDTIPKGAFPAGRSSLEPETVMPPQETVLESQTTVLIDGERIRVEKDLFVWSRDKQQFDREPYVGVFDGTTNTFYHAAGAGRDVGMGFVRGGDSMDTQDVNFRPLLMTFRATDPKMGRFNKEDYVKSPTTGFVGEDQCIILKSIGTMSGREWWVAPGHDFLVRRHTLSSPEGRVNFQVDIEHRNDPRCGWVPASWKSAWLKPDGTLRKSSEATVTKCDVNLPLDDAVFQVEFPSGTLVRDLKSREMHFQLEGNTVKPIKRSDVQAEHDINKLYAKAVADARPPWGRKVLWYAVLLLALGALGAFWWRYRPRKKAEP